MAASVMGAIATVIGALAGAAVGALFNGTPVPLLCAMAVLMTIGAVIMLRMPRERATQA
jgi:MFS transporter, DHA1 family, multidrug resistance protein